MELTIADCLIMNESGIEFEINDGVIKIAE